MMFVSRKSKEEWFITPTIGVIDQSRHYGRPVFSIAFAWLRWRCKFMFGVDKWGE